MSTAETLHARRAELSAQMQRLRQAIAGPAPSPATAAIASEAPLPLAAKFKALAARFRLGEATEKEVVAAQRDAAAEQQAQAAMAVAARDAAERDAVGRAAIREQLSQLEIEHAVLGNELDDLLDAALADKVDAECSALRDEYRRLGVSWGRVVATGNALSAHRRRTHRGGPVSIPMHAAFVGLPAIPDSTAFKGAPTQVAAVKFGDPRTERANEIVVDFDAIERDVEAEIVALVAIGAAA